MNAALPRARKRPPKKTPEELFWEEYHRVVAAHDQAACGGWSQDIQARDCLDRVCSALGATREEILARYIDDWERYGETKS
jgi:hypothetical protein